MMFGAIVRVSELHRLARQQIENARKCEEQGALGTAGKHLHTAAKMIRGIAERQSVQVDRVRLFCKANEAEEKAKLLDSGQPAFNINNNRGQSTTPPDEYQASVDELIYRSDVAWDDIAGMDEVKRTLKYALGMILAKVPDGVKLDSLCRILLFGPPGTGKSLLAAASSNLLGATFFNVKASDLVSKYFGESSKLISALFARARSESESGAALIFIDEIDALCRKRGRSDESGVERRILSTFLAELDGVAAKGQASRVITMAATNHPWDLSNALMQRFERHFLVDLPDHAAREQIFRIQIEGSGLSFAERISPTELARATAHCSGRDIRHICKDAVDTMIRSVNGEVPDHVDRGTIRDCEIEWRPLQESDFQGALSRVRPACSSDVLQKYRCWGSRPQNT